MRTHLVYFHPDKKHGYGATRIDRWPGRLTEQKLDVSLGKIIKKDLTLREASVLEIELQERDGYPPDPWSYKKVYNNHPLSQTKEAIDKRVESCDYKKVVKARKHKQKEINKKISDSNPNKSKVKAFKVVNITRNSHRVITSIEKVYIKTYDSLREASSKLNVKSHDVSAICRGNQMTTKGYTFEYADRQ